MAAFKTQPSKQAVKSIDTFLYAYVDFYYNLNYIDIETALNEDIKDQKGYIQSKFFTNDETDKNKLEEISYISSVSGGSLLIGLIYSLNNNKLICQ